MSEERNETEAPKAEDTPSSGGESLVTLNNVTVTVTSGDDTTSSEVMFNTPKLLEAVRGAAEGSTVKITAAAAEGEDPRVLAEGPRDDVADQIEKSTIPNDRLPVAIRNAMQHLLDHSNLRGIGVHAVYAGPNGEDHGVGFVVLSNGCTKPEAVMLVNCGDANLDEFISKLKIEIPGRGGVPQKGTVIAPTPEQVEQLG